MQHAPRENLPRHCHRKAFATIVLTGGYDEAGDTGRHRVSAGDVIFHKAFESHLDQFHGPGAEVLVIPLTHEWDGHTLGSIDDPDAIVRAGEKDPVEALQMLTENLVARPAESLDWPDRLAAALRSDPSTSLEVWAEANGLHPGSLGRGFVQIFGVTPAFYRRAQRARRAIEALVRTDIPLSRLAFDCGFADQAHMTRAVAALGGAPPALLRRHYRPVDPTLDTQSPNLG
jgi:AraC-like DNA-binding protein